MNRENVTDEKEKKVGDIKKEAEGKACAVQQALYFINEFISGPMCGKCFPCALGTAEAKFRLGRLTNKGDHAVRNDIELLKRIGLQMIEGSFCKKGKDVGKYIVDMLSGSEDEFMRHLSGVCPKGECEGFVQYFIKPELCDMCGKCLDVCNFKAILGEKQSLFRISYLPFEIRQNRCTKCGECIKVCPTGAIEIRSVAVEELVNQ
jgi:ferredoxin